ncbi:MAG: hypothetical protein A4E42_00430 [Methanoregulaceae archaeon PtaU1.Bin222]|nr:MAG: hypothetical protein A4E42_00430 [Methanoregulaceae archaeon PtaU1.Bin222]
MALHPVKFVDNYSQQGCPFRHLYAAHFFERLDKDHVVNDRANPTDALGQEHHLLPGPSLHDPFDTLLHVAKLYLGRKDEFSPGLAFDPGGLLPAGMHWAYRDRDIDRPLHYFLTS